MRSGNPLLLALGLTLLLQPVPVLGAWAQEKARQERQKVNRAEDQEDYYAKWLKEDVVYIIGDEEKAIFNQLSTDEEKEQFIEQFWLRRDPDPRTRANEFKEEHYRRIAYANEKYPSGDPGWMTDRGRIYILHGKPDEIISRPTGGQYQREIHEGGGTTGVYPFEKWRYRHIEGVGSDIELEFVDPTYTGEFKLAADASEKDAFLHSPGGATLAEITGIASKADRSAIMPAQGGAGNNPQNFYRRLKDAPFARYETLAKAGASPPIKYTDLKELVEVNISYDNLPFQVDQDYFRLNEQQVLVPVTVRVRNKDLTFKPDGDIHVARMAVYGIVTSMTNRFVVEFEHDLVTSYRSAHLEKGLLKSSVYQKVIPVADRMRYKLVLIVKDLNSGNTGVLRTALLPPTHKPEQLSASSLILSDQIQVMEGIPTEDEMFVLGDVRILPNPEKRFTPEMPLGVYLHDYNDAFNQTDFSPSLKVTYRLFKGGDLLAQAADEQGESTQFFSGQRVVVLKRLSLNGLEPGRYRIQVEVEDQVGKQSLEVSDHFKVVAPDRLLSGD